MCSKMIEKTRVWSLLLDIYKVHLSYKNLSVYRLQSARLHRLHFLSMFSKLSWFRRRHLVWHHDPGAGGSDHHCVWENGLQCSAWVQTEGMEVFEFVTLECFCISPLVMHLELMRNIFLMRKQFSDVTFLNVSFHHQLHHATLPPEKTPHPPYHASHHQLHHSVMN